MSMTERTLGKRRKIGLQILVSIVTFGIYGIYWAYTSHEEIKQYSARGSAGCSGR